jgi:hypothetical protein
VPEAAQKPRAPSLRLFPVARVGKHKAGCPTWAPSGHRVFIFAGCPTLAAYLFLRLGWETNALNQPRSPAGCPTLAAYLFLRLGWETNTLDQPRSPAGCPTLAAYLFLRLGWETNTLNQPCPPAGCPTLAAYLFLRLGWETNTLNQPCPSAAKVWFMSLSAAPRRKPCVAGCAGSPCTLIAAGSGYVAIRTKRAVLPTSGVST